MEAMLKNCVALNLRFGHSSHLILNELSCYRLIVGELKRFTRVLYARPYLFNTQSLSKDGRRLDIVVSGQKQLLTQFFNGLRGIQINQIPFKGSSPVVPMDQPLRSDEDDDNGSLEHLHEAWKQQLDIYQRLKHYRLHGSPGLVRVSPWMLDIKIPPAEEDYEASGLRSEDADEMITLKSQIYSDFESMPFEMQKWFIGLGLRNESDQFRQDRLDILTHGFKGFA